MVSVDVTCMTVDMVSVRIHSEKIKSVVQNSIASNLMEEFIFLKLAGQTLETVCILRKIMKEGKILSTYHKHLANQSG